MTYLLALLASTSAWINQITPLLIHFTLQFFLYVCISPLCTKFSPSSIDFHIVVNDGLQTQPRWMHETEVVPTVFLYWLQT